MAITRPYETYSRGIDDVKSIKVLCVKCKGVLFIADKDFDRRPHGIEIKCRKCGFCNKM
uniref:Uncharacterized protein n=1 Tax=viral metagenome TaxID=1070528 RepID=A0A6M3KPI6_9ZZZZ